MMQQILGYAVGSLGIAILAGVFTFTATYNTRGNPQGPQEFAVSLAYAFAAGAVALVCAVAYIIHFEAMQ